MKSEKQVEMQIDFVLIQLYHTKDRNLATQEILFLVAITIAVDILNIFGGI